MQKPSHCVHENEQSLGSPAAGSGPLSNPLLSLSHLHVFFFFFLLQPETRDN